MADQSTPQGSPPIDTNPPPSPNPSATQPSMSNGPVYDYEPQPKPVFVPATSSQPAYDSLTLPVNNKNANTGQSLNNKKSRAPFQLKPFLKKNWLVVSIAVLLLVSSLFLLIILLVSSN